MRTLERITFLIVLLMFVSCKKDQTVSLKVLQLNTLHQCSMVADGIEGLVNTIDKTDPDVILLCELKDKTFVTALKKALQEKGKDYHGEFVDLGQIILSKYKVSDTNSEYTRKNANCGLYEKTQGAKGKIEVAGQIITFYSLHLDSKHYGCYMPRGYDGYTWKKMEAPSNNADTVLAENRKSYRDESVADLIEDAKKEIEQGHIVILGGDFNEPSHLDWQADTKNMRSHNGLVVNWDCSVMLEKEGYKDTYRELYPNPVTHPGFTFAAGTKDLPKESLRWTDADDRDRIDFVYYMPNRNIALKDATIVGPVEDFCLGELVDGKTKDPIFTPEGMWPTDHKGNLVTFNITVKSE